MYFSRVFIVSYVFCELMQTSSQKESERVCLLWSHVTIFSSFFSGQFYARAFAFSLHLSETSPILDELVFNNVHALSDWKIVITEPNVSSFSFSSFSFSSFSGENVSIATPCPYHSLWSPFLTPLLYLVWRHYAFQRTELVCLLVYEF